MALGNKVWWTVSITYSGADSSIGTFRISNLDGKKLREFRETVFTAGAYRRIDDDTGEVISPFRIRSFMCYKQAHFFNAQEEDKPLIKKT